MNEQGATKPTGMIKWVPIMFMVMLLGTCGVMAIGTAIDGDAPDTTNTPRMLAGWACSNLRDGTPESAVVPALSAEASKRGVDLRETLTAVEDRCPDLLN